MAQKQIPDKEPAVGNDPMAPPQLGVHKKIIAPDPEKVRQAEQRRKAEEKRKPDTGTERPSSRHS